MTPRRPRRRIRRIIRLATVALAIVLTTAGLRTYLSWRGQQEASDNRAAFWSLKSSALNQKVAEIPSLRALINAAVTRVAEAQAHDTAQLRAHKGSLDYKEYEAPFALALQPGSPQVRLLISRVERMLSLGRRGSFEADFSSYPRALACEGIGNDGSSPAIFVMDDPWIGGDPFLFDPEFPGLFCKSIVDGLVRRDGYFSSVRIGLHEFLCPAGNYVDMSALRYIGPPAANPAAGGEISRAESRSAGLARQLGTAGLYGSTPDPGAEVQSGLAVGSGVLLLILAVGIRRYRRLPGRARAGREGRLPKGQVAIEPSGRDWAQAVASALVASAVAALDHPADRERYSEEWGSDMTMITGRWSRLWWAIGVRIAAAHALRAARRAPSKQIY
jgi:hypothetical protein